MKLQCKLTRRPCIAYLRFKVNFRGVLQEAYILYKKSMRTLDTPKSKYRLIDMRVATLRKKLLLHIKGP